MLRQRSVRLSPQELLAGAVDDQQPPIRKVPDAHWKRRDTGDDFALAGGVEPEDFVRAPVRDPEGAIASARQLAKQQSVREDAQTFLGFGNQLHGDLLDPESRIDRGRSGT